MLGLLSVGREGGGGVFGEVGGEFVGWGGWVGVRGVVDGCWDFVSMPHDRTHK